MEGLQNISLPLILASASPGRAAVLRSAGLEFRQQGSGIDEAAIREALSPESSLVEPEDIAELLARTKAEAVSAREPGAMIIGGDQILVLEGRILEKPTDFAAARTQLMSLRGKTHVLISAVCLCRGGETIWCGIDTATLKMRHFSPEFLGRYLALAGTDVLGCVGAYQFEGPGVQLFSKVDGDYFTIIGMPLIPLLEKLRELGVVAV